MRRWIPVVMAFSVIMAQADEGMWPPSQLPALRQELKGMGMQTDPARLADLTSHPMNAVISLGGCTASFVSPEGLVVTNHHCAYGAIQYNSSAERNLLEEGFVAPDRAGELPAGPGSRVLVTVQVEDVTEKVLGTLEKGLTGRQRYQAIEDTQKELVASCEKDAGYRCRVSSFYGGLQYQLVKQLEIRDVRLVYAPPQGVGKFGGDIDNWMWPRHTGDFAFYRAYVNPEGQPADPAESNVPYRPAHFLRIAPEGVEEDDFVMVAGYPGRTNRYRLATEVDNVIHWTYPVRKQVFGQWLDIIAAQTEGRPDAAILYASRVAGLNNAAKNYQGLLEGFGRSDVVERKTALENDLQQWIGENPERQQRFGTALSDLRALAVEQQSHQERGLYYDFMGQASGLLGAAKTLYRLSREQQSPDSQREPGYQERDLNRIRERLTRLDRSFDAQVDRAVWREAISWYAQLPLDQHAPPFDAWFGIEGNTVDEQALERRLDSMYAGTGLGDQETRLAWMGRKPEAFAASDDPFIQLAVKIYDHNMRLEEESKDLAGRFREARPRFMEALVAFLGSRGQAVYPDANSTLRVTVGRVQGSSPRDGMTYQPFTTLQGILEKDTGEEPFDTPPPLLEAMRSPEQQPFASPALGSVPVNFLSNLDTTGGNSGSPTMNDRGELVGLLFDGTYESIISDWDFLPEKTRAIHVDIRYLLWVMVRTGGADGLLQEMGVTGMPALQAVSGSGGR